MKGLNHIPSCGIGNRYKVDTIYKGTLSYFSKPLVMPPLFFFRLVFFEAFILEVLRYANVSPTTVSHRAKIDTEVDGYLIPKVRNKSTNCF